MITADQIFEIYLQRGASLYVGEPVTVVEHGLQSAHFARSAGACDALVIAALLHDIGHLLDAVPDDVGQWNTDAQHELTGSRWLAEHFTAATSEPVRLHVAAKRYLCATDPAYLRRLSCASAHTLKLQGGPMSAAEVSIFEGEAYHRDAVLLRQCDDQAKVVGLQTPGLDQYGPVINRLLRQVSRQDGRKVTVL